MNEVMDFAITDQLRHLQAQLFPVLSKAGLLTSFLQNTIKSTQLEINTDNRSLRPVAKLKEPRELFALPKELDCPQQAARWPTECQVLDERVHHIEYLPPIPEAYYSPTGRELQPKPVGEEDGCVVYQYYPMSAVNYFSRSSVGGSRYYRPSSSISSDNEDDLSFESRFESGNLAKVVKITDAYYELYLRTDLYTNRHMQWFYFRVSNTRKHFMYRLSIVNLSKPESLYNEGMRPLLYSTKDAKLHSIGWRRCGENISYFRNDPQSEEEEQFPSYTLTFTIEFPHERDTVYIAHCYPYTYTDLQDYLGRIQNHPIKSTFCKLRLLCRSLAGNNVYYLTITAPPNENEVNLKKKKAVVVTARVHPGETPASYMMKGLMDFLTGDSNQARELREKFIFKIVPMLNPDGVIVGNNRCSLTGRDLNRQYRTVIRETYPPVWHTKLMIRRLIEECGVVMYCDMHAHSRKHNVFIYGCENKRGLDKKLQEQVFPLMLHKNAADKFSFENCKFRIQRSKEGTGRVVVWLMGVANSYTMEASFGGSELGGRSSTHFSAQDYEQLGRAFCETLLDFCDEDPSKERLRNKIMNRLIQGGSSADEPTNITLSDYSSDDGDTSSSSEEEIKYRRDDFPLIVPPPSPVLPHKHHKPKKGGKKSLKPLEKKSQMQRKKKQVFRSAMDLPTTDPGSDLCDLTTDYDTETEGGRARGSPRRTLRRHKPRGAENRKGRKHMPPELIVTPAQASDLFEKDNEVVSTSDSVLLEFPPLERIRTKSWHHFRSLPSHKALVDSKCRLGHSGDLQVKLTSIRRSYWTGTGDWAMGISAPLSWGMSKMIDFNGDSAALLKSCSQKLFALQKHHSSKNFQSTNDGKTVKKKTVIKPFGNMRTAHNDNHHDNQDSIKCLGHKKTRLKHSKAVKTIESTKTDITQSSLLYIWHNGHRRKSLGTNYNTLQRSPQPTRNKFKTGGLVATAVQTQKHRRQIMKSDESSDSESEDTTTQKTKKKKKKRKNMGNKKKALPGK